MQITTGISKETLPTITSRINGMVNPFQQSVVGVLHRYTNAENQVLIHDIRPNGSAPEKKASSEASDIL